MTNVEKTDLAPIVIRKMVAADLARVSAMEQEIFSDSWPLAMLEGYLGAESHSSLVVEVDRRIIGYACYSIEGKQLHLANLAVDPAHRRKSVAKRMFDHILDLARRRGCGGVVLEVRPSNQAALGFYRKVGFEEIYRLVEYYDDPVEDAAVMALWL